MAETETDAQAQGEAGAIEASEFSSLLNKEFKPKSERSKEAVEHAVATLAEQVLSDSSLISDDVIGSIEAIIAELDKKLTEQVNAIMHHEDFQKLEGAWRGLHYLVNNTASGFSNGLIDEGPESYFQANV